MDNGGGYNLTDAAVSVDITKPPPQSAPRTVTQATATSSRADFDDSIAPNLSDGDFDLTGRHGSHPRTIVRRLRVTVVLLEEEVSTVGTAPRLRRGAYCNCPKDNPLKKTRGLS